MAKRSKKWPYVPNRGNVLIRQPRPRDEVMKGIDKYYKKYQYSKNILNIEIDRDLEFKYMGDITRQEYVNEIFDRYKLLKNPNTNRPFDDEKEYADYLQKNSVYNNEQIAYLWKDYKHIKGLVLTGQYENARLEMFRDNYIKAMKQSGLSDDVISNLKSLSLEDFSLLANSRNPDKNSPNKWRLPELGGFEYINANVDAMKEYANNAEREIRQLFKEVGLDFVDSHYEYANFGEHSNIQRSIRHNSFNSTTRKAIRTLNRLYNTKINRVNEDLYTDDIEGTVSYVERSVRTMKRTTSKGTQVIKKSKKGEYYIPFIGSTKIGTKNRNLLLEIVDLLNLDYK